MSIFIIFDWGLIELAFECVQERFEGLRIQLVFFLINLYDNFDYDLMLYFFMLLADIQNSLFVHIELHYVLCYLNLFMYKSVDAEISCMQNCYLELSCLDDMDVEVLMMY